MKPSERLAHWENLSPSEFVALRREITQLEVENAAFKTKLGIVIDSCTWEHDEDSDTWMTSCGNLWVFTNDGPKKNDCHYCMYCGGVLEVIEASTREAE